MSFAPHEVYSRCLPGAYGYPLWTPELKIQLRESYQLEGLKIGDVGIVSVNDGSFDVLFNITLPRNEQPYPKLVREDFAPVILDPEADIATQLHAVPAHDVISSASIELVSREFHSCEQKPPRVDYDFSLPMEDGAVLILPEGAQSCDLANEKRFLDEAIQHAVDWYECATEEAGRFVHNDTLYLITGFHKTRSWSLGAAGRSTSSRQNRRSVKFQVGQIDRNGDTAAAYLWSATHGFSGRVGPMSMIPNHTLNGRACKGVNQTVFIRGFRITVNKILFLKIVSVKTRRGNFFRFRSRLANLLSHRRSESTQSSGTEGVTDNEVDQDVLVNHGRLHADTHITIDRVADVCQVSHPGDSINQYLLKKEPRAVAALTHDRLWIEMLQTGLLELADFSRQERLEKVLSTNYRIVVENGKCSRFVTVFLVWPLNIRRCCIPSKRVSFSLALNVRLCYVLSP
ncbi:hypothetical protein EV363DRAFT_1310151 [Boletus edulis]|nr:hypothetical protein EV363DRAFT_1310151 [Boletus edulis]